VCKQRIVNCGSVNLLEKVVDTGVVPFILFLLSHYILLLLSVSCQPSTAVTIGMFMEILFSLGILLIDVVINARGLFLFS